MIIVLAAYKSYQLIASLFKLPHSHLFHRVINIRHYECLSTYLAWVKKKSASAFCLDLNVFVNESMTSPKLNTHTTPHDHDNGSNNYNN